MENPPSDCRKAIQELERGRELATELRRLIQNSNGGGHDDKTTPLAVDLSEKVVTTFSNSLLLLNLRTHESQMQRLSSSSVPAKSDDSEDSCKSTSAVKERRGCYKRRRISPTSVKASEAPIVDDYAWRKYGQKIIMNNKYPRNYYRCTHKFEQGCLATKQVQRIQEEPVLYSTTYYGHHTCKRNLLDNEIILDSNSPSQSSILLSFDKQAFFSSSSSSSLPLTKKQCKEEVPSSSSEDYLLAPELITLSSTLESNHGDPISDMLYDHVLESFDF